MITRPLTPLWETRAATPDPADVTALADQIAAALARVQAIEGRVTWLETQVRVQQRPAPLEGPPPYAS